MGVVKQDKFRKMIGLWVVLAMLASMLISVPMASANNTSYYVDCSLGSNGSGTSGSPWNTLSSVNGHAAFLPGDQILLKKGTTCSGQLAPLGSGSSGSPITIDSYGSGAKPIINGGGIVATITLSNQQYWVIQNLEITNNNGTAGNRSGIRILNNGGGTLNYFRILNNNIHDVDGASVNRGNGGIIFNVQGTTTGNKFNDILVQGNTVTDVARDGIFVVDQNWAASGQATTNVSIKQNVVTRTAGDGIVLFGTDGGSIDGNVGSFGGQAAIDYVGGFWVTRAYNSTIQNNEYYSMNIPTGSYDSEGFDVDVSVDNATIQYNYSHDNEGGGYLICAGDDGSGVSTNDITVRYNISQNDAGHGPLAFSCNKKAVNLNVYNNTFYLGSASTAPVISSYGSYSNGSEAWSFKNNIVYQLGSGGYSLPGTGGVFDYNTFYGNHPGTEPSDSHKSTADPLFVSPGTGGTGRTTVNGYKLRTSSPALGSGVLISGNGGVDYYGNAVSSSTAPNRGAYNGVAINSELLSNPGFEVPQWDANNATLTHVTTDFHSGARSMKASSRTQLYSAATQIVTDALLANGQGTYNFSSWAKFATSGSTAFSILWVQDSAGTHWYNGTSTSVGTTSFTQLNGTGNVTWTGTLIKAQLYVQTDSSLNDIFVDDFTLTKGGGSNLINNPGMEQVQWYGNQATLTREKTDLHSGSYGVKVSARAQVWASAAIDIKDILNTNGQGTYNFSAWAKMATGSDTAFVIINLNDSTGNHLFHPGGVSIGTGGFTQLTDSRNITWTGSLTSAILYVQTDLTTNDFYVDDYSLIKQ